MLEKKDQGEADKAKNEKSRDLGRVVRGRGWGNSEASKARNGKSRDNSRSRAFRPRGKRGGSRKRPSRECDFVDFKDVEFLRKNCTPQWKIQSRKRNGTCAKCQNLIKLAVKRARFMALVPYVG